MSFFSKNWPQYELDGLVSREIGKRKMILPVWHMVDKNDVMAYSAPLADRVALKTNGMNIKKLARALGEVLGE